MKFAEYKEAVQRVPFGKRVVSALYVFCEQSMPLEAKLDLLLEQVRAIYGATAEYNVVKLRLDEFKVSFLSYPDFLDDPHPALRHAITVDLATGKRRETDYSDNLNPPILHRKEAFLPPDHPKRAEFATLTAAEETTGLYEDPATIGFRLNWERLLAQKGVRLKGHSLVATNQPANGNTPRPKGIVVERHKTAMVRYDLSKPVKTLMEHGLLKRSSTVFDYGCGQGADVEGLRALGFDVEGWDPVHRPQTTKREADIVNLGYVLNVIEDPAERLEALIDAYRLARRLLVVSALIQETVATDRAATFADGVLTRRGTFQKFYEQHELQQFLEDALETTVVPAGLGTFYAFRDPTDQQDFLSARTRRAVNWAEVSARLVLYAPGRRGRVGQCCTRKIANSWMRSGHWC